MKCQKCGMEYEGNFCPNCGTKKETSKKIADIFYFNYEGRMGFYKSYRNFCLKNMILFNLAIPGKEITHVTATPTEKKVSEESTKEIQNFVAEKMGNLTRIEKPKGYEIPQYFMVTYTDGICEYYLFNQEFYLIFQMCKFVSGECDTILTPYLVFEDTNYAPKIKIMESIAEVLNNKKIRDILSYVSDDCVLEENYGQYNRIKTKQVIEKEIKRRSGFMGTRASKAFIYASLEGSINEHGESVIEIKLDVHSHQGEKATYLLAPVFNRDNEITKLEFSLFYEKKKDTKTLWGEDLAKAKQSIYNDYK